MREVVSKPEHYCSFMLANFYSYDLEIHHFLCVSCMLNTKPNLISTGGVM